MHKLILASAAIGVVALAAFFSARSTPETVLANTRANAVNLAAEPIQVRVDGKNPWTNLGFNNQQRNFQFAIITDRTGGHRPGVFAAAVQKINLMQPEFVISVGDLIEGYSEDKGQ